MGKEREEDRLHGLSGTTLRTKRVWSFRLFNIALLGKWKWRVGTKCEGRKPF